MQADPRFPVEAQFAVEVTSGHLGPMAPQGSKIVCLDLVDDFTPEPGEMVLVQVFSDPEDASTGRYELRHFNGADADPMTTPIVGEAPAEDEDFIVLGAVLRIERPVFKPRLVE